jgi:diaminopimelate epimerase
VSERGFKYHGLGNDFLVLDRRTSAADLSPDEARRLCDRHCGVGGDGVLVLLPSDKAAARMVVHNADGSIAEMCGNGIRCVAKYLGDRLPSQPTEVLIDTGAGLKRCALTYSARGVSEVEVEMGPARLVAPALPSERTGTPFVEAPLPDAPGIRGTAVSMGNPHLVLELPTSRAPELGPTLEHAVGFPERTNVEFVERQGAGLKVVVWERGVGLTQACGTGACAAAAAMVHLGRLPAEEPIRVELPGGPLGIRVAKDLSAVTMRGPVELVFEVLLTR